jgi:hypothetical protein
MLDRILSNMNVPRKTADTTTDAMVELIGESFRLNSVEKLY